MALTRYLSPDLPPSSLWKRGEHVEGNADIPVGTPIATFNFYGQPGTYGYGPAHQRGGVSRQSHTGIYLGQNGDGVIILHQYARRSPRIETIPWQIWGSNTDEAGNRYYTISY